MPFDACTAKSKYLHYPSLGLRKLPGGCMYKFAFNNIHIFTVHDGYLHFNT